MHIVAPTACAKRYAKITIFACGRLYQPHAKTNSANKKNKNQKISPNPSPPPLPEPASRRRSVKSATPPSPVVVADVGSSAPTARTHRRGWIRHPSRPQSSPAPDRPSHRHRCRRTGSIALPAAASRVDPLPHARAPPPIVVASAAIHRPPSLLTPNSCEGGPSALDPHGAAPL